MIESVLQHYSNTLRVDSVESLANAGGFSGAQLWKANVRNDKVCIRRWPIAHPSLEHLQWIHSVLLRAKERGCDFVPAPLPNNKQQTIVSQDGHFWEITPWLPGTPDLAKSCTEAKIEAAFQALARFHLAVSPEQPTEKPSAGVQERMDYAIKLNRELPEITSRIRAADLDSQTMRLCSEIADLAKHCLSAVPVFLKPVVGKPLPHQPCIRDVWHQHVLFQGDQVTGIIDYGAMRIETVALDLARLLGSLPWQNRAIQRPAIETYLSVRELSENEVQTMFAVLQASSVLSALTWVRWLVVDRRKFENMDDVRKRLEQLCSQLRR